MKNKTTILLFMLSVAGLALGIFFLMFGLYLNDPVEVGAAMVSKTIYIVAGSLFAFVATCIAAVTLFKMAEEEEKNQKK